MTALAVILTSTGITVAALTVHVRGLRRRPESRNFYRMMERSYDNPESLWAGPIPKRRRFR